MAKLLTIGCSYVENNKVVGKDGSITNEPMIYFYFNADAKTANMVAGSGIAKGLSVKGDSLIKKVKVDNYKNFIYGKNLFPKIISEFEKYGYEFDMNSLDDLCDDVETCINNFNSSGIKKQIDNDVYDFIEKLIDAMEKNMNDPDFITFLNSIGNIRQFVGDENISTLVELSTSNKIMALTQWIKAGRQGHPTFLATKKQYMLAGYSVNQDALRIFYVYPLDRVGRSKLQTIADYGIKDYDSNDLRKVQVDRLSHDIDYGDNDADKFALSPFPFYDISDCTQIRPSNLPEMLEKQNNGENSFDDVDKDKQVQLKNNALSNIENANKNVMSDKAMCDNALKYAQKIGDKKLERVASVGSAADVISFLANNAEAYLRNRAQRNGSKNAAPVELVAAVALKKMGLGDEQNDAKIAATCGRLRVNNKVNKLMFFNLASDLDDIYNILMGLTESSEVQSTLKFVLDACGISVDEFKSMPNTEEEAQESFRNVREGFVRTFNKMLKTEWNER